MYKGSKKTQYFGQQMKLNGKIWDAFQSNLVKSCEFSGTFNGFLAKKSLAAFIMLLFLRSLTLVSSTRYMVSKVNWFSGSSSGMYNAYDLICSFGSWDISTALIIIVPFFGMYTSNIFFKNKMLSLIHSCVAFLRIRQNFLKKIA